MSLDGADDNISCILCGYTKYENKMILHINSQLIEQLNNTFIIYQIISKSIKLKESIFFKACNANFR